jgi:hypothetical protein
MFKNLTTTTTHCDVNKEDAMSARRWATTLPIAHNLRTKKRRRRGTRRRARTTRRNIKVMLMLVKSGSLYMKTPIKKVWQL